MQQLLTKYLTSKSAGYNKVLVADGKLTEKGEQVVATWSKVGQAENNEALIKLPDGRVFPVTAYSVPSGNLYELLNFSREVAFTKEAQAAHKWVVTVEDITVDEAKLVSPTMLNDIITEWTNADSQMKITPKTIAKERKLVSDFNYFYADAENFYIVGAPANGGIDSNIVFFRKVQFANKAFESSFVKYNHYTSKEERMSWIAK